MQIGMDFYGKYLFGAINNVCQIRAVLHHTRMKTVFWIPAACALVITLSSCGNNYQASNPPGGTGPFDANGTYREDLADDPSKWGRRSGSPSSQDAKPDQLPEVAKNDQPPLNSNPLPPANTKPVPVISHTEVTAKPKHTVEKPEPIVVKSKRPVEKTEPAVVKSKHPIEKADPEVAKSKSKPKPVEVKAKPKSTRYVVKAGDSLSAIASRTGASVSAIQRENGISGTLIRPGQTLTIPKK